MNINPFKTFFSLTWWARKTDLGMTEIYGGDKKYDWFINPLPMILAMGLLCWTVGRFTYGLLNANSLDHCRIRSIGDAIVTPMYAIGCNVGKDRFDIRVN